MRDTMAAADFATQRVVGSYVAHALAQLDAATDMEAALEPCQQLTQLLLSEGLLAPQPPAAAEAPTLEGAPLPSNRPPPALPLLLLHEQAARVGWKQLRACFLVHHYQAWASGVLSGAEMKGALAQGTHRRLPPVWRLSPPLSPPRAERLQCWQGPGPKGRAPHS